MNINTMEAARVAHVLMIDYNKAIIPFLSESLSF